MPGAPRSKLFARQPDECVRVKRVLTCGLHAPVMVSRRRLRSFLTVSCLYVIAALLIGYFGVNAYTGNRGLNAKHDLDVQAQELNEEITRLKGERALWDRRVTLLRSQSLDPDMLDERARGMLDYVHANDLTFLIKRP
jgi:cell division protein FtsB